MRDLAKHLNSNLPTPKRAQEYAESKTLPVLGFGIRGCKATTAIAQALKNLAAITSLALLSAVFVQSATADNTATSTTPTTPASGDGAQLKNQNYGPSNRNFRDPLNRDEVDRILAGVERKNPKLKRNSIKMSRKSLIPQDPVLLLIEKRPLERKGQPQLSDVYYYDYQKDRTIHCIVDPSTGEVHKQRVSAKLQLPLIDEEVQRAFDIYLQSRHRSDLAAAYLDATGQSLIDVRKVHFKAYTFHGAENEKALNKKSRRCGKTRCAQILLYTEDNIALNLSPVVNLAKATVVQANTLPSLAVEATAASHLDHAVPHDHEQ